MAKSKETRYRWSPKTVKYTTFYREFFHNKHNYNERRYVGGCIHDCFRWSSLPCFVTFCHSVIPTSCYIFNVYIVYLIFLAAGACISWGLPSHSSKSLSSQAVYMDGPLSHVLATLAVLAEESLIPAPFKHQVNPSLDGWQSQLPLSEDWGYS